MHYSNDVLNIFFNGLLQNDSAKQWLYSNGYEELTAFINGLYGIQNAENWLINKGQYAYLGHLSRGIKKNTESLSWLINGGYTEEAALIGMIHENSTCEQWLLSNEFYAHLKMGEILRNKF